MPLENNDFSVKEDVQIPEKDAAKASVPEAEGDSHPADGYKAKRRAFVTECVTSSLVTLLMCTVPLLIVWVLLTRYNSGSFAGGLIVAVVIIAALVAVGFFIREGIVDFSENYKKFKQLKCDYLTRHPENEQKK